MEPGVRIAFELTGEHPTLPRADALAALEAERVAIRRVSFSPTLLIVDAVRPTLRSLRRVALSRFVETVVAHGPWEHILQVAGRFGLDGRRFRVRAHGPFEPAEKALLERQVGALLARTGSVDLERAERDFRILRHGAELLLVEIRHAVERSAFEARKGARRGLSHPISLHPKFARALVNLSRCPVGGVLLDPFCGMGGIAIEAARLGIRVVASDFQEKMVRQTEAVLREFGPAARTFHADVGEVSNRLRTVDAIATDPPYGRSTTTRGEPVLRLYRRAFAAFRLVLRPHGYAAIILPSEEAVQIGEEYFDLEERHSLRVHRSLTRTFCAFARRP